MTGTKRATGCLSSGKKQKVVYGRAADPSKLQRTAAPEAWVSQPTTHRPRRRSREADPPHNHRARLGRTADKQRRAEKKVEEQEAADPAKQAGQRPAATHPKTEEAQKRRRKSSPGQAEVPKQKP